MNCSKMSEINGSVRASKVHNLSEFVESLYNNENTHLTKLPCSDLPDKSDGPPIDFPLIIIGKCSCLRYINFSTGLFEQYTQAILLPLVMNN